MLKFLFIISIGFFLNGGTSAVVYDTDDSTLIRVDLNGSDAPLRFYIAVPPRENIEVDGFYADYSDGSRRKIRGYLAHRPAFMRDIYVLPLDVSPGIEARLLEIKLTYSGAFLDKRHRRGNYISPEFADFYRTVLLNPGKVLKGAAVKRPAFGEGAELVVITLDDFVPYLEPFLQWKRASGILTRIYTPETTGSSPQEIKNFLQNAYYNWEIPPEYVLFVSDTLGWTGTENYYGTMDDDSLNDLIPGRLPASDTFELKVMVRKIIAYEKDPYLEDPSWFKKATLIVREDNQQFSDSVYWADVEYVAEMMADFGYVHIDTFWNDGSGSGPNDAQDVIDAVTEGRSYVLFRGQGVNNWWPPFSVNPQATNNDKKLPIVISGTCSTAGQEQIGFTWLRAGANNILKGAVGFFGTTGVGHGISNKRSLCVRGFFDAVFADSSATFGLASEAGRLAVYGTFGELPLYDEWRTLGDPSLKLWTSTPESTDITAPDSLELEASNVEVLVFKSGIPVEEACVSILQDTVFIARGYTDAAGSVLIPLNLETLDTLYLTVTGKNLVPVQKPIPVYSEGPFLSFEGLSLDDSPGNGNGELNPGEEVYLGISVANLGRSSASDVVATLTTDDPYITLIDSIDTIGTLLPDSSLTAVHAFRFGIDENCPSGRTFSFSLCLTDEEGDTVTFTLPPLEVRGALLMLSGTVVEDIPPGGNSDGILQPGEAAYLNLTLHNESNVNLHNIELLFIRGDVTYVFPVEKRASISQIPAGESGTTDMIKLSVTGRPSIPIDLNIPWTLALEADAGTFTYRDTLKLFVKLGSPDSTAPTGPDPYGYFIYDDNDESSGLAPEYNWFEIAPPGPGEAMSSITDSDDDTATTELLFDFNFYGTNTSTIGVSTNGLFEFGSSTYPYPENFPIPGSGAPNNFVAALWEDLDPASEGDIYQYFDFPNHRWLIEFKDVYRKSSGGCVTFQIIFLDPDYNPTPTGDGEIIIQYADVDSAPDACVGFEGPEGLKGLQYVYGGEYDLTASPIISGRALRITTLRPQAESSAWIVATRRSVSDETGGNGNGRIEPGENIELYLTLANFGDEPLTGVEARIASLDGDVTFIDSTLLYGEMEPGESIEGTSPFTFQVSNSPTDSVLEIDLKVLGDNGYESHSYIELPLYAEIGVNEGKGLIPERPLKLYSADPNPLKEEAVIAFSLPDRGRVAIELFDVAGRKVATIYDKYTEAGFHRFLWKPRNSRGNRLASGVYFLSLYFKGERLTKKLMVVK